MSADRPTPNDLYREAQRLIQLGQPVFPCRPHDEGVREAKSPRTKNGWKDATLDRDQVKRWWKAKGDSALGIPTGVLYDVLDVDIKPTADGRRWMPELHRLGLLNGCKRVVKTPSGGFHLYFIANPTMTNKAKGASLGLDVRGKGGYVLAPPSYIVTKDYEGAYVDLGETKGSDDTPLLWDLIVSCITPTDERTKEPIFLLPSERRASIASLREFVANLQEGERNNGMFWAICRCIDNGIDPHELVEPAILAGLGEEEILLSVDSALKRAGLVADDLESEAEAMFPDEV